MIKKETNGFSCASLTEIGSGVCVSPYRIGPGGLDAIRSECETEQDRPKMMRNKRLSMTGRFQPVQPSPSHPVRAC